MRCVCEVYGMMRMLLSCYRFMNMVKSSKANFLHAESDRSLTSTLVFFTTLIFPLRTTAGNADFCGWELIIYLGRARRQSLVHARDCSALQCKGARLTHEIMRIRRPITCVRRLSLTISLPQSKLQCRRVHTAAKPTMLSSTLSIAVL